MNNQMDEMVAVVVVVLVEEVSVSVFFGLCVFEMAYAATLLSIQRDIACLYCSIVLSRASQIQNIKLLNWYD